MEPAQRDRAAGMLAEAWRTGVQVGTLPFEGQPRSQLDGHRIAARTLDMLDLEPCGLRLTSTNNKDIASALLSQSLLEDDATISLAALHGAQIFPAIAGILAEDLPRRGDAMPVFATLHPALDITAWRFAEVPTTSALAAADLGGLGRVVMGKGKRLEPMRLRVSVAVEGSWKRGVDVDIESPFMAAALAARRGGGLDRGSLLIVQLGPGLPLNTGTTMVGSFGRLGRVSAHFS
jgi:2-keto-4-pentenoate hydratase